MAIRQVLAELGPGFGARAGCAVAIEAMGGVEATRRVQAGEPADVVFLAAEALARLEAEGRLVAGSAVPLAHSGVAVAVRQGARPPKIDTEAALRDTVMAAASIGYSTGPSGTALLQLFERWGIAQSVKSRMVQAPAGVPVGAMVARGEVALGFQQLSELMHLEGVAVVGPLPDPVQIVTTFSGAVCAASAQPQAARALLAYLASPDAADAKRRHGLQPA